MELQMDKLLYVLDLMNDPNYSDSESPDSDWKGLDVAEESSEKIDEQQITEIRIQGLDAGPPGMSLNEDLETAYQFYHEFESSLGCEFERFTDFYKFAYRSECPYVQNFKKEQSKIEYCDLPNETSPVALRNDGDDEPLSWHDDDMFDDSF
eukprot:GHVL01005634.1.p1 GENE.GHVL01005634.1~~GHVL01005634.1.p1  ORF type:complete len:151 (+),score=38.89 GHVL01005634.1:89-541(+)